jgi:hypothetical protein
MKRRLRLTSTVILAVQIASFSAYAAPEDIILEGHKFPERWHIQFFGTKKNDLGSVDLHFTAREGRSCLGSKSGKSFLIVVDRRTHLSSTINVTESPALSFDGSDFVIDLTGGICDAYVLIKGAIPIAGVAAGEVSTLGWSPPRTIGTFVATPMNDLTIGRADHGLQLR